MPFTERYTVYNGDFAWLICHDCTTRSTLRVIAVEDQYAHNAWHAVKE